MSRDIRLGVRYVMGNVFFFRRFEMEQIEREKQREREIREMKEKELSDRIKDEIMRSAGSRISNQIEPHWMDLQRRYILENVDFFG